MSADKTLRRKLKTDTDTPFIMRQKDGERNSIDFMDFWNIKVFEKSKMGVVSSVILKFNEKFSDITKIDFQSISEYESVPCMRHDREPDIKFIRENMQSQKIYIVDKINDDYSPQFCEELKKLIYKEYNIQVEIRKRIVKNSMNLCLIHNAEYYIKKKQKDPHKQYSDMIVQRITFEDFKLLNQQKKPSATIAQALHELLIKADLLDSKITLFDWSAMGINCEISFGIRSEKDKQIHYFFMTVRPDGTFEFDKPEFTFFEENKYSKCIEIFEDNPETIRGVILDEYGNINIIRDTRLVTIPEIFKVRHELENGNTAIKNEVKREELFSSVIDIKQFRLDDSIYYFAGVVGKSLDDMSTAVNIRRIDIYDDSEELFSGLLKLMDVGFVRNRQLTVVPFPFKYLREYVKKYGFQII